MKKYIRASSLTKEFLKYHEDPHNANIDGFEEMYKILNKYGDESEYVDVVFDRAPIEDQKRMIELIKPKYKDGSKEMYAEAISGEYGTSYSQGVIDMFQQLRHDGYIDEARWGR